MSSQIGFRSLIVNLGNDCNIRDHWNIIDNWLFVDAGIQNPEPASHDILCCREFFEPARFQDALLPRHLEALA